MSNICPTCYRPTDGVRTPIAPKHDIFDEPDRTVIIDPSAPGSGGGGGPTPLTIGDCEIWLDASDASTLWTDTAGTTPAGISDLVARWDDKSGNGRHVYQATSGLRFTRATSTYLTGTAGQQLEAGGSGSTIAQPFTICEGFYLGTTPSTGNPKFWNDAINGSTDAGTRDSDFQARFGTNFRRGSSEFAITTNLSVVWLINGSSSDLEVNGATASGVGTNAGTNSMDIAATEVQAQSTGTDRIFFLVIFSKILSSGEKSDFATWVNNTFGF